MSGRVPVATTWLQSCSGCHIALLDLHEELLDLLGSIDIRYSPIVDVKEVPETDLGIVEGSVGNRDNTEMLLKFRERSKTLIAFGTCACFGGIPGLRNLFTREELLRRGYVETGEHCGWNSAGGPRTSGARAIRQASQPTCAG